MEKVLLDYVDKIIGKKITKAIKGYYDLVIHFDDDTFIVLEARNTMDNDSKLVVSVDSGYVNYRPAEAYSLFEKGIITSEKCDELMLIAQKNHEQEERERDLATLNMLKEKYPDFFIS